MENQEVIVEEAIKAVEGQAIPPVEEKGWRTAEEKDALAEESLVPGADTEALLKREDISKWTLKGYQRKYLKRQNKLKVTYKGHEKISNLAKKEKVLAVNWKRKNGVTIPQACKKVGITCAQYNYWKALLEKRVWATKRQNGTDKVRKIKTYEIETISPPKDFNKPIIAERDALRKLVVDMALDIQALKEELGRRV